MASTINGTSTGNGGLISTGDDSGILNIQTNETTAITVDASQRAAFVAGTAALPAITTTGDTNTGIFFPAADTIAFSEGGAESMRISSVGNVFIGSTTAPTGFARLSLVGGESSGTGANSGVQFTYNSSTYGGGAITTSNAAGGGINFYTFTGNVGAESYNERMRIDSSGNFLAARTSAWTPNSSDNTKGFGVLESSGQTLVNATGSVNALIVNNTNTNNRLLSFRSANTEVGGVTITSSTATFNGTSDSRLKEDLGVSTDTSVIDNTIIHDFKWTRDGTQGKGVFAQEAYEVYPLAVSKGSDELNESGNLSNPWQVNYSQYIPDLIVYCQQLKKTVDTQAETINALTARIVALEEK
jgi:predicted outer membrane repeat protein